jgi:hypothetical protein
MRSKPCSRTGATLVCACAVIGGCSLTALDGFDDRDPAAPPGGSSEPAGSSDDPGSNPSSSGVPGSSGASSGASGANPTNDAATDAPQPPRTGDGSCFDPYRLGMGVHTIPGCSDSYPQKCDSRMPIFKVATDIASAKVTVQGSRVWRLSTGACGGASTSCSTTAPTLMVMTPTSELVVGHRDSDDCTDLQVLVEP